MASKWFGTAKLEEHHRKVGALLIFGREVEVRTGCAVRKRQKQSGGLFLTRGPLGESTLSHQKIRTCFRKSLLVFIN